MSRRPAPPVAKASEPKDIEQRVDELTRTIQSMVELKTGFAEDHIKSRQLQKIFAQFDIDHTQKMNQQEFCKVLEHLNVNPTRAEMEAMYDRYDVSEDGTISFKEFSDAVFGITPCPYANPVFRDVLIKLREKLLARARAGDEGVVRGLSRTLRVMDANNSGCLDKKELTEALLKIGLRVEPKDIDTIVKVYDRDGSGSISLTEFLRGVRGRLNARRRDLVMAAYKILDKNNDESITLAELADCYDTVNHPAVKKGTRTPQEVLQEFMGQWDKDGSGTVTWVEWLDYYKDISGSIELDDYFELMMRNAWRMSGGEGWCQNTSCRRVLVTLMDDSQSVQEIKNDLGIGPNDLDKMKRNLEAQGIKNIKSIKLTF